MLRGRNTHGYRDSTHDWTAGGNLTVAEQVPAVCDVLATIERRDWAPLERLME
jgi:hypothetical protein